MSLLKAVADAERLRASWAEMHRDAVRADRWTSGLEKFERDSERQLAELSSSLVDGTYRPRPLVRTVMGGLGAPTRELQVPTVRDRVLERAVLAVITPALDPWISPAAFGYRKGLGVRDALREVALLRDEGFGWVARTDVHDCFPRTPVRRLVPRVRALLPDGSLDDLLDRLLLGRDTIGTGGRRLLRGLAQGAPLAPLLSNVALAGFDNAVRDAGWPMVRYADDIVLFARSEPEARNALAVARREIRAVGFELGEDKSAVMSFADGFCFLGSDIGPQLPLAMDDMRLDRPMRRTLFVALPGGRVRTRRSQLVVETKDDVVQAELPCEHVARIMVFGPVGVSAGARTWALSNDVEVVFLSGRGRFLGAMLNSSAGDRVTRRRVQLQRADDQVWAIPWQQAVVRAKALKQTALLQRFVRPENADDLRKLLIRMRATAGQLELCVGRDEVMGIEGAVAKQYFDGLALLLPLELGFRGRTRRPPRDVANAALSFLYAVLLAEATSALVSVGLDPAVGLLHVSTDDRPSLALDLLEEFRPLVADQVVVEACRQDRLRLEHGRAPDNGSGILLTKEGKRIVLEAYERRMLTRTGGALAGFSGSWRRHLYRQAERLAIDIETGTHNWTGLAWR